MSAPRVYYHEGDQRPAIHAILGKRDPLTKKLTGINLSGATSVGFMLYADEQLTGAPKESGVATIIDAATGEVEFAPGVNTFDTAGQFWGAFDIDWGGGEVETLPDMGYFSVVVHPKGT